jgi:uncharacterized damage-inducible protein DinB
MGRQAIANLLWMMDEAFAGPDEHSLISNLMSVPREAWFMVPEKGSRSIGAILGHVGACKYMYADHAFGAEEMTWESAGAKLEKPPTAEKMIEWTREGQRLLRSYVEQLPDDDELLVLRKANWGEMYETRRLIRVMIEHDLYHAGEINHIRSLMQGDDRWAYQRAEEPESKPGTGLNDLTSRMLGRLKPQD